MCWGGRGAPALGQPGSTTPGLELLVGNEDLLGGAGQWERGVAMATGRDMFNITCWLQGPQRGSLGLQGGKGQPGS